MLRTVIALSLIPALAFAQTIPTKPDPGINMLAPVLDETGKPYKDISQATKDDPNCEKCGPISLGTVIARSLGSRQQGDERLSFDEIVKRGMLAIDVQGNMSMHLNRDQINMIEKAVVASFGSIVVARVAQTIDPAEAKAPPNR